MKVLYVEATWRSYQRIEVEDDVAEGIDPDHLSTWPDDVLDEVDALNAELVDWGAFIADEGERD